MKRPGKIIILFLIFILFVGLLAGIKAYQIASLPAWTPRPEAITSFVVKEEFWIPSFTAVGSVEAVQGVMLQSEQAGKIAQISVESGAMVKQGDLLFQIDSSVETAQLNSAVAREDLARRSFDRATKLLTTNGISRAEFDDAAAELKRATADAGVIKAVLDQKNITAPFSGRAGIRLVNLGQFVEVGAELIQLHTIDPVFINFSVPQTLVSRLKLGQSITVVSDAFPAEEFHGQVSAINPAMDLDTRSLMLQARIDNTADKLRPGMFVKVELALGQAEKVIVIPASAVSYAPYGNSVFIIENLKDPKGQDYKGVTQHFIKLGSSKGDLVAVTEGLSTGQEIASTGIFKLRNGAAVLTDNSATLPLSTKPTVSES